MLPIALVSIPVGHQWELLYPRERRRSSCRRSSPRRKVYTTSTARRSFTAKSVEPSMPCTLFTHRYTHPYNRDVHRIPFSQQASFLLPLVTLALARRKTTKLACCATARYENAHAQVSQFDVRGLGVQLCWHFPRWHNSCKKPRSNSILCFRLSVVPNMASLYQRGNHSTAATTVRSKDMVEQQEGI